MLQIGTQISSFAADVVKQTLKEYTGHVFFYIISPCKGQN